MRDGNMVPVCGTCQVIVVSYGIVLVHFSIVSYGIVLVHFSFGGFLRAIGSTVVIEVLP